MSDAITRLSAALEGRYRVERELGEGGMATVYLADDIRHERKVALKVLKPELAAVVGADRFLAEIKTTANLQHPHILPLFDSGEADGFLFYVMPYIDGETLREKIGREKQLPVDEALGIATAVASALQLAHDEGVVHRDIKPGNILLSRGEPLVADFGIALAVGAAGGSRLTETGLSVGTPFYMSPEQATGDQAVGTASDTYALACVLYEMLVGEPPYLGNTAQAVLGKIIQGTPVSATAARPSIPRNVDAAIRKALEKIPADRFPGPREFAQALADPTFRHGEETAGVVLSTPKTRALAYGGWGVAAVLALGLGLSFTRADPPAPVERFASPFLPGQEPALLGSRAFDLSADGRALVYRGPSEAGGFQLWVRRWDDVSAAPVRETGGALDPEISPDGRELAFSQAGDVKVLAFEGGPVRSLTAGEAPLWGPENVVYVTADSGLARIPAGGGTPELVTRRAEGEAAHVLTDVLPDGRTGLMFAALGGGDNEMRTVNLETGEQGPSLGFGAFPAYAPTGHLLFESEGALMGAPFDARAREITGATVGLIDGVLAYYLSDTGKLFYSLGAGGVGLPRELVWVSRTGEAEPIDPGWTFDWGSPNTTWMISPDGSRLALTERTESGLDIWVKQLDDGPRSRISFAEDMDLSPAWTPDGRELVWVSGTLTDLDVWSRPANTTREARVIVDLEAPIAVARWSPDGEWLVMRTAGVGGQVGGRDIVAMRPGRDSVPVSLMASDYDEIEPALSPDGRWIAYASNETGRYEVFVRPFPEVNADRWQLSTNGGTSPRWAHGGSELFFMDAGRMLVSVSIDTTDGFRAAGPEPLFEVTSEYQIVDISVPYDVDVNDERFVLARTIDTNAEGGEEPQTMLVQNFFEVLKRRVPR